MARWLVPVTVLWAAVLALFPLHNDDTGFHIATGRWVLATGQVPDHNPFSYVQDGATWVTPDVFDVFGLERFNEDFATTQFGGGR